MQDGVELVGKEERRKGKRKQERKKKDLSGERGQRGLVAKLAYILIEVLQSLGEDVPRVLGPVGPAGKLVDERRRKVRV